MPDRPTTAHVVLAAEFILRAHVEGEQTLVDQLLACQVTCSRVAISCVDHWTATLRGDKIDPAVVGCADSEADRDAVDVALSLITGCQAGVRENVCLLFDQLDGDAQMAVTTAALAVIGGYHRDRRPD